MKVNKGMAMKSYKIIINTKSTYSKNQEQDQ